MTLRGRFADLWQELRGHHPVIAPSAFKPTGPDHDSDDLLPADIAGSPPAWPAQTISGRTLIIRYTDSKGGVSERQVVCHALANRAGVQYLAARCLLRNASRSFRLDRIAAAIDPASGEIFEPADALFAGYQPNVVSTSKLHYGLDPRTFGDFNAALNVLAFIARCDGRWHALEGDAIVDFAASFWLRAELTAELDEAEVKRHAARLAPDPEVFWTALDRCSGNPVIARIIRRHITAVIDADGTHHPLELFWGRAVDEVLSST